MRLEKAVVAALRVLYWATRGAIAVFTVWWLVRGYQIITSTDYEDVGAQTAYHVVLLVIVGLALGGLYMLTATLFNFSTDTEKEQ